MRCWAPHINKTAEAAVNMLGAEEGERCPKDKHELNVNLGMQHSFGVSPESPGEGAGRHAVQSRADRYTDTHTHTHMCAHTHGARCTYPSL